jgi:hypothetical protein
VVVTSSDTWRYIPAWVQGSVLFLIFHSTPFVF